MNKKSTNRPNLAKLPKRFQEFDGRLPEFKLQDLVTFKSGGTPSMNEASYWNGDIPWISAAAMQGKYYSESDRMITKKGLTNGSRLAPRGTLLLLVRGSMLFNKIPIGIAEKDVAFNQDVKAILTNGQLDTEYLYQWFSAKEHSLLSKVVGTGIGAGKLNMVDLNNLPIFLPSLPEQQKIAAFLTSVDTKIQQLTKKKALLEQYKKGVMQKIFKQEIRFKDEKGRDYPKWEERTLGELGTTYNGLTGKSKEDFGTGVPFITYKQIFDSSRIDTSKFEFVRVAENENQSKAKVGDIFFTTSSETAHEIGFASVLLDHVDNLHLNSFCFGYRPNSLEQIHPEYSRFYFRSSQFRMLILKLAQGSTRYNMSKVGLMEIRISLPCHKEQKAISAFLTAIESKIDDVSKQIELTRIFKKGLLQQMFV